MTTGFLPVTRQEMEQRGITQPDFVYVSGDAYVDHPSFGTAIITRLLESYGYSVGIIAQPDWKMRKHHCVRGTASGLSCVSRQYGFHGESLYRIKKHRSTRRLFSRRENGASP